MDYAVVLVLVEKLRGFTLALRLAIGLSGILWAKLRMQLSCEQGNDGWNGTRRSKSENTERERRLLGEIHAAWVSLGTMLKWSKVLKLRNTFKYLAAWLLLSDGKSYQIHLTYGL